MRQFILIAGFVLASATAQAADRSLTLAENDVPSAAAPQASEAPKYVERPAVVEPKTQQPKAELSNPESAKPVARKTASAPKAEKVRRKRYWNEARIINELHRHGIYW